MANHDPHAQLVAECHDLAHRVFSATSRSAGPDLMSLELTMGQFKALAMVTTMGQQAVGELGRQLGISEPAASLLVDKLEELGLAVRQRDPADRRRTLVCATPRADDLAQCLREGRREHVLGWLDQLSDDELGGLVIGFRGLLRTAEEAAGGGRAQPAGEGVRRG